jgi:uncharacterized membrane protein YgcG
MRPLLREGEVGQAVQAGVLSSGEVLAGRLSTRAPVQAWMLLGLAFLAFIAVQWWQEEKKKKRYAQATRQLTALEAAAAEAKAARYACTSCPICMEDFAVEGGAESEKKADSGRDIRPPSAGLQKSLLRCGHSFCAPCLARALAAKLACPICRAPPDGPEPRSPSLARQASSSSGGAAAAAGPASCSAAAAESAVAARDWDGFMPELVFRLRRLQVLYPDVVSHGMVDRWTHSSHLLEGGFANDQAFLRADPSRRPPVGAGGGAMARSTSGTSPRFGGGKSGGGGGGGW